MYRLSKHSWHPTYGDKTTVIADFVKFEDAEAYRWRELKNLVRSEYFTIDRI